MSWLALTYFIAVLVTKFNGFRRYDIVDTVFRYKGKLHVAYLSKLKRNFEFDTEEVDSKSKITNKLQPQMEISNEVIVEELEVEDSIPNQRLDAFLSSKLKEKSRSFIGELCTKGLVTVNNKSASKSYKVCKGDKIIIRIPVQPINHSIQPENIPLDIIYEDDDIIAVNKPNGMVIHPAIGSPNGTFANALLFHIGEIAAERLVNASIIAFNNKVNSINTDEEEEILEPEINADLPETPEAANASPPVLRPGIVHRLDKGTTGLLLAAKHPHAVDMLSQVFSSREIVKVYLAICVGHPGDTTIVNSIGRSTKNRQLMCVYDGPPGKLAITHTKTIAFDGKLSVVLVRIETGRTHQIRVHLKERRTPILGDTTYGNQQWNRKYSSQVSRPLLHAYESRFFHPITDELKILRAPLPEDMFRLIKKICTNSIVWEQDSLQRKTPIELLNEEARLLSVSTDVEGKSRGGVVEVVSVDDEGNEDFNFDEDEFGERRLSKSLRLERLLHSGEELVPSHPSSKRSSNGGTRVISPNLAKKGYVPSDRLMLEEEDWTSFELPDDPEFFKQ